MMINRSACCVLFLLLSLLLVPAVLAQSTEDVVYLKNGGVLRGEILESGEAVRIQTAGRNIFVIPFDEVDEIAREEIEKPRHYRSSGYINQTGVDYLSGSDQNTYRFQMMNGYRFSSRFAAGVGLAYIPYNDPLSLVPLYLDVNYRPVPANVAPFLYLKAGYNFSIHTDDRFQVEDHRGGWMLNPGIGLEFNSKGGFRWFINAGYNVNNARYDEEGWQGGTIENDIRYRRATVGLGFIF